MPTLCCTATVTVVVYSGCLYNLSSLPVIIRRGSSFGGTPGVLFSSGVTWREFRRTSLHTLRDFGFGKETLEDIIEEEIDNFISHIDNHFANQPMKSKNLFNIPVLASLWRIISGEALKIGDPKLEYLVRLVNDMIVQFGKPITGIGMQYVPLFHILNFFGIMRNKKGMGELLDFNLETITKHKERDVDGENPITFTEAMLHKIQETTGK